MLYKTFLSQWRSLERFWNPLMFCTQLNRFRWTTPYSSPPPLPLPPYCSNYNWRSHSRDHYSLWPLWPRGPRSVALSRPVWRPRPSACDSVWCALSRCRPPDTWCARAAVGSPRGVPLWVGLVVGRSVRRRRRRRQCSGREWGGLKKGRHIVLSFHMNSLFLKRLYRHKCSSRHAYGVQYVLS